MINRLVGWLRPLRPRGPRINAQDVYPILREIDPTFDLPYYPLVVALVVLGAGVGAAAIGVGAHQGGWLRRVLRFVGLVVLTVVVVGQLPEDWPYRTALLTFGVGATAVGLLLPARLVLARLVLLLAPYVLTLAGVLAQWSRPGFFSMGRAQNLSLVAAAVAGVVLIATFAQSLEERREAATPVLDRPRPLLLTLGVLVVKAGLVAIVLLGVFGELLGPRDIWTLHPEAPLSWLHAAVLGSLTIVLAVRAQSRPVAASGLGASTGVAIGVSAMLSLSLAALMVVMMVQSGLDPAGPVSTWDAEVEWYGAHAQELQLAVTLVLGLAAGVLAIVRRRLTTGSLLMMLVVAWLVPGSVGLILRGHGTDMPRFWATPLQVEIAITAAVAVGLVALRRVPQQVWLRLLIIPAVVIYAGILLPDSSDDTMWRVLMLAGVVWLLAVRSPEAPEDPHRRTVAVLGLVGGQLLIVALYVLGLSWANFRGEIELSAELAFYLLAVPVAMVLAVRRGTGADQLAPVLSVEAVSGRS